MTVPVSLLKEAFEYDPSTGTLTRRVNRGHTFKGEVVGTMFRGRYKTVHLDGKRIFLHRIAWAMHYGSWPEKAIDHINGDGTDNRIENLRECTVSENQFNSRPSKRNTSGYKGVSYVKRERKFRATIKVLGKTIFIGLFLAAEDAARAYDAAALTHAGQFARPNFADQRSGLAALEARRKAEVERIEREEGEASK